MNIDEMPAGREMDALIAEKVMGIPICPHSKTESIAQSQGRAFCIRCDPQTPGTFAHYEFLPRYSTSIAAAWEVVEKLSDNRRVGVVRWFKEPDRWLCQVGDDMEITSVSPTAPLAISRAALKAVL